MRRKATSQVPWVLDGPKKRADLQVPERLLDIFDAQAPSNQSRNAKIITLIIKSLEGKIDIKDAESISFRAPSNWPAKDRLLRNALLLKITETLEKGSMDPNHFDQLMQFAFASEEELQKTNEES